MSAEDVLYTESLRKSQADGIFALRHRAHDIAREIESVYDAVFVIQRDFPEIIERGRAVVTPEVR